MTETEVRTRSTAAVELHINQSPDGQIDAVAPLRWCLSPELAEEVRRESRHHEPMLVIIDRSHRDDQGIKRWVVPLTQEMQFLSFTRAGTHRLSAFVVTGTKRSIQSLVLTKSNQRGYHNDLFLPAFQVDDDVWPELDIHLVEGEPGWHSETGVTMIGGVAELSIEVPAEMFAREPRPWRKNYLNLFFRHKPEDQCHNRKRTLFLIWFLPIIWALSMAIRLTVTFFSLIFCGRVNLKQLTKPFSTHAVRDAWVEPPNDTEWWKVPGAYWFGSLCLLALSSLGIWVWNNPGDAGLTFGAIVGVCALVAAFWGVVLYVRKRPDKDYILQEDELASMVCYGNLGGADVALATLAKEKRTIRLRFANLKSKVCRPYQS